MKRELRRAVETALAADMIRAEKLGEAIDRRWLTPAGFRNILVRDVKRGFEGEPGPALFPNVRAVLETMENAKAVLQSRYGMGQWDAIFNSVLPALTDAAGKYATAKLSGETATDIAKIQAQQQALVLQTAQLQADRARLELAKAQGVSQATAVGPSGAEPVYDSQGNVVMREPSGWGIPGWAIGAGVVTVVGTGVYIATR